MSGPELLDADLEAIRQLKYAYLRCLDLKRWDEFAELFIPDATGAYAGLDFASREELVAYMQENLPADRVTLHQAHHPEITVDGDTATGIWAMQDIVTFQFPDEEPYTLRGYGHYHETYTRTPDGWRLASSHLTRLRVDTEGELPAAFRG